MTSTRYGWSPGWLTCMKATQFNFILICKLFISHVINKINKWIECCALCVSVWRKFWATWSPASPENQPWLQFVCNRSVIFLFMCCIFSFVFFCFFFCSWGVGQCVAVVLVPALSSVLQLAWLHTEWCWFLPTGPVKASGFLCDGSIHINMHTVIS